MCVLIKDIGRRFPLELQSSLYQGQQGDVNQNLVHMGLVYFIWDYSDRAYYWVFIVIKDIGRRLPLELQSSLYQGQQDDVNQSGLYGIGLL